MIQTIKENISTVLSLAVLSFLLQYSIRTLAADVLFISVQREFNYKTPEMLDVIDISAETMPSYLSAIDRVKQASLLDPGNSMYHKTLSDLHARLGIWVEVVGQVEGKLTEGSENDETRRARDLLKKAIGLEPSNPDYHLALYSSNLSEGLVDKPENRITDELEKAVQLYPNSSQLRYEVALQYLLLGEKINALEHAKALAARDDSYRMPDTFGAGASKERRSATYITMLARSYLTKAFEIAWRASGKDYSTIKAMTPDEQEARDAFDYFVETKGIDLNLIVQ